MMKKSVLVGALLLLGAPLFAQRVAPPGYDKKEGLRFAYYLGSYANGRYQIAEGGLRGIVTVIGRIGFRLDNRTYYTSSGMGRTWTNVKLSLSHCTVEKMTRTWTRNNTDTPVKLFDAKYSWPSVTGRPKSVPAPFGQAHSFPLTSNFIYLGKSDLLMDWVFRGGTLTNNGTWATPAWFRSYYFDAPNVLASPPVFIQATLSTYGSNNCTDSSHANPALMVPQLKSYAKATGDPKTSDKFFFQLSSYFTAPGKPAIQVLGLVGSSSGVSVGACNNLHVTPLLFFPAVASGITSAAHTKFGYIPYDPKAAGATLWLQAAYSDSVTTAFSLTKAASVTVPTQPPSPSPRRMVYHSTNTSTTGFGPYNSYYRLPVIQYAVK